MVCEMLPIAFDGLSATLHRRKTEVSGLTVVICAPVGRDRIFTYRALFDLAEQLAECGIQVLRFDHKGYGDSLDLQRSDDQWAHWISGVRSAYRFARETLGSTKVVLAGLRIGATLARLSTADLSPDGLFLLDPIVTGDEWLRELRRARAMMSHVDHFDDGLEVHGLWISNAAVGSLGAVDLTVGDAAWPRTLVMSPSVPKSLAQRIGPSAKIAAFPGYGPLFKDSHLSVTPIAAFKQVEEWLLHHFKEPGRASLAGSWSDRIAADGWAERHLETQIGLRGVLCEPSDCHSRRAAVLFINTAANPRSGDGNFATRIARALADTGVASLRVDLLGIGDSRAHPDSPVHVYDTCRKAEITAAANALIALDYENVSIVGICTGGYHTLQAICGRDGSSSLRNALIINAWITWKAGTVLDRSAHAASMRAIYLRAPAKMRKALVFRHKLHSTVKILSERLRAQFFPEPEVRDMLEMVARAAQRGANIRFLMGQHDRAWESLSKFGVGGARLSRIPGVSIKTLEELDHSVISLKSQDIVLEEIQAFIGISSRQHRYETQGLFDEPRPDLATATAISYA